MKTIIAGSRNCSEYDVAISAFQECPFKVSLIVSGGAKGVDKMGESLATELQLPLVVFHANWEGEGRKAGPLRNIRMGDYADALIAIWDGKSTGTKHMIDYMIKLKKPVFIWNSEENTYQDFITRY